MNQFVAIWNLGLGESSVFNLALAKTHCGVVLDDLQARKCAKVLNLPLIGSLGLIVKAKKEGLVTHIQPCFDKLISAGLYVDKNLIQHILSAIKF